MRFLSFVSLVTIFFPTAISEDLFFDNPLDRLAFQDPSEDLLALQDLPETSDSIINANDDDLFADSNALNPLSIGSPDSFSDLTASCSIGHEQSLNKLRSRDEEVCSPQSPTALQREPPSDDLKDVFRKVREFLGFPGNGESTGFFDYPKCRPDFPHHLCCYSASDVVADISLPGTYYYENVFDCYPGTYSPFFCFFQKVDSVDLCIT